MTDVRELRGIQTVVIHSGGMDSSLCLALAVREFGADRVLSLGFDYGQRHGDELERARRIADWFGVRRYVVRIGCYGELTQNALMDASIPIDHRAGQDPNTLVVGRNGLMVRLGAILAEQLGANSLYTGIIGVEAANSGYRDCTREYMDLMEQVLRIDLGRSEFEVRTPLVDMTKKETMDFGYELGCLEFLLDVTVTCYEGVAHAGCGACPACRLRNEGILQFLEDNPSFQSPFRLEPR